MIKFIKLTINPKEGHFENISYLSEVIKLIEKYRKFLLDDYFLSGEKGLVEAVIKLVEKTSPCFWLVINSKGKLCGFIYLDDWTGTLKHPHSATVTTCFAPQYWGRFTKFAGRRFIKYVFKKYKLKKLKAEVYAHNRNSIGLLKNLGFEYEATLKAETIVNTKLTDIEIFSVIRTEAKPLS